MLYQLLGLFYVKASFFLVFSGNYMVPDWLIGLVGRVFANSPGDQDSIPSQVIPKTFKMVLDTNLLNTQPYMVCIKDKEEQSKGVASSPTPHHSSY